MHCNRREGIMKPRETAVEADVRQRTDFSPLVRGGFSFCSHTLDRSKPGRIRVVATGRGSFLGLLFFIIAAAATLPAILTRQAGLLVMPLFFSAFGVFLAVRVFKKRAVFDLSSGCFVRGKTVIPFARIVALQVLKESCHTKHTTFSSWELNLVLDDASRINVFDHGDRQRFDADLAILAEALEKPVWNRGDRYSPDASPGRGVLFIIGILFLLLPGGVFMLMTGLPLMRAAESRHWIAVPATVTESQLYSTRGSKGRRICMIDISVQYEWQGRRYNCDRYDFFRSEEPTGIGIEEMRRIVREHPVGRQCECLVNPDNPAESVMSSDVPVGQVLLRSIFALLCEAIGIGLLIAVVRSKKKNSPTADRKKRIPSVE